MHAYYLQLATSDGNQVERFTDVSELFERVAEVGDLFDYSVTGSYLAAVTA